MMPQECHAMLAAMLAGTAYSAPEGSPFRRTGHSVFRMAAAYESDGLSFMAAGDPVNALAAFLYGFGWLHCGAASGLLIVTGDKGCPFIGRFGWIPASQEAKLNEKTGRYSRLLGMAIDSTTPAPDHDTPAGAFAEQVRFIARLYLARGEFLVKAGNPEEALACFSYGHGWLDAGVGMGLFSILAHREIFTVD